MARLYEYQAKEILRNHQIPVPKGKIVATEEEAVKAIEELELPLVLKAQILAGSRKESGGIAIANSMEEVRSRARELLAMKIGGMPVEILRVEEKIDVHKEYYICITADPKSRCPVAILSSIGGTGVEDILKNRPDLVRRREINILKGLRSYEAIRLIGALPGIPAESVLPLSGLLVRLYEIYRKYDCRLVEINPAAVGKSGITALDARIEVDNDALYRQRSLGLDSVEEAGERPPTRLEIAAGKIDENDHRGTAHFVQLDPDGSYALAMKKVPIGFDCVGTGSSMTMMDELVPLGYYPVNFADTSGNPPASKLYRITKVILSQPHIKGYLFASCVSSQQLDNTARGIIKALLELYPETGGLPHFPLLLMFRGSYEEEAIRLFKEHGISRSPWVKVLGRPITEVGAAKAFDQLFRHWLESQPGEAK